jgi:16S rRNA (guanine966-N2)-methyltransferase
MRIVAGQARGRRLVSPSGTEVRPTGDRVREAVFNALGSLGVVHGARVLDLFAGSGALGIEALSRGAAHTTFVDSSRASLDAVRRNLVTCGLEDRATVVRAQALGWLRSDADEFDLVLLDPPYAYDAWHELLAAVPAAAVLVIESDRDVDVDVGGGREVMRHRRYGSTVVSIVGPEDRDEHGRSSSEERS